jgi:membrane protein required for colicin V production
MNSFDAAVYGLAMVAVVTGYNAGLLRSIATILAYLAAMPIAVATTSLVAPALAGSGEPWAENSLVLVAMFLVAGVGLGTLLRTAISESVGPRIGMVDRLAGSMLGVARMGLVAVTVVLVFDQLIPVDRQPAFLNGSRLRPILSVAGQQGLKSLPPDVTAFIVQLKRDRRI